MTAFVPISLISDPLDRVLRHDGWASRVQAKPGGLAELVMRHARRLFPALSASPARSSRLAGAIATTEYSDPRRAAEASGGQDLARCGGAGLILAARGPETGEIGRGVQGRLVNRQTRTLLPMLSVSSARCTSPVSGGPVALREGGNPYGKSGTPALAYMYPAGRGSAIPPSPHCPPAGLSVR